MVPRPTLASNRKPIPMPRLRLDLETFSSADLRATGVYRYAEDPSFLVLMASWHIDGGATHVAVGEDEVRMIPGLRDPTVRKVAHNANFDRVCLSRMLGLPTGTYLDPDEWDDTAARAGEAGYPQKLETLAHWLGGEQKDTAGSKLIRLFCVPARDGHRVLPEERPEEWAQFVEYCRQDSVTLADVDNRLPPLTPTERQVWVSDQRINDRGMAIDLEMAHAAVLVAEDNRMVQELEISHLTGVANPGSQPQMLSWLQQSGLRLVNLRAETIETLLSGDLSPLQRRVLELRQELALVASKKFTAAVQSVSEDDRLRGGFRFFGAHTGRWSGRGVQPHNLPRAALDSEAETLAAILDLKMGLGAEASTLKALVRALFTGPFTVVDYRSIEAIVLAWLTGEQWVIDAFLAGRDIYVETANRMGGLTRAQGKIAVLALGYNGGVGSLRNMGAEGGDAALQIQVNQWRRANPNTVAFWGTMGEAFRLGGSVGNHVTVERDGDDRLLRLPSGRAIAYHHCKWTWVDTQYGPRREASFADPKIPTRARTYGGRLSENVTQAIARDILAEALVRLHREGYDVVGHVHDEILIEGTGSVKDIREIVNVPPAWAKGLPIDSAGFQCARYQKG